MNKKIAVVTLAAATALGTLNAAATDYASTVAGLNPVAYYRFNTTNLVPSELAATNKGSLGASFNGEYRAMALLRGLPGAIKGDPDTAVAANGSATVVVPWGADYNTANAFTVEAWLNPASDAGGLTAPLNAGHMADPRAGWILYQNGTDGWSFRMYNQNALAFSLELVGSVPVATNTWYHIAATYDGTTARFYVDGAEVASGQPSGTPSVYVANPDSPLVIGARSDFAFAWKGMADEVAIYTTALSAGDVQAHYQNGTNSARTQSYESLVQSKNPAIYLRLGEPALELPVAVNSGSYGAAGDGYFLTGTRSGVPGLQKPAATGFETNNLAAAFNGTSGSVQIPGYNLNTDTATMVCWIKRDGTQPARAGIMHNRNGSVTLATGLGFLDDGLGLSYNWEDKGEAYNFNPGFIPPDQTWTFVAVAVAPENAVLYMGTANGLQAATNNFANNPHDFSGATIEIGWDNYQATRVFRGAIDEFALWDKTLTYDQVAQLYNAALPAILGVTRTPPDPVYEGMNVAFQTTVAGPAPVTYQWRKDGTDLPGQTASNLVVNTVAAANSGAYDVQVTTGGQSLTSPAVPLNVQFSPPIISTPPASAVRFINGTVKFSATVGGSLPLTLQWKHGSQPIAGATSATLVLTDLQEADAGDYTLTATNPYGVKEATASLSVVAPTSKFESAVADSQPAGYWRLAETTGTVAYDYWGGRDGTFGGGVTPGQPGPRPGTFAGFSAGNTAYQFDGGQGKVVIPPLNFNKATATIVAWIYPNGAQADYAGLVFSRGAAVSGLDYKGTTDQLGYHWNDASNTHQWDSGLYPAHDQWNFVALVVEPSQGTLYLDSGAGLTSAVNDVTHGPSAFDGTVQLGQDGTSGRLFKGLIDDVVIYDRALSQTEIKALRDAGVAGTYSPAPVVITQQPKSETIMAGNSYTLSAVVSGSVPITYQWQKNGQDIPGATRSRLTFASAAVSDTGAYQLVVTQGSTKLTSATANLTVKPVPTHVNIPDGLVLHLKFDGDYKDSSGRGNDGAAVGSPQIVTGKIGSGAVRYSTVVVDDAISEANYVSLNTPADLQFGSSASFSVAFWTKFTGGIADLPFLCNNADSYGGAGFVFAPSWQTGSWSWSLNDGSSPLPWPGAAAQYGNEAGYPNSISDGQWHHLVFIVDRTGDVSTYSDGVKVHAKSIAGLQFNLDTGLSVNIGQGAYGDYKVAAVCEMDDLGVWRRPLTHYEAQAIYVVGSQFGRSFDTEGPPTVTVNIELAPGGATLRWSSGTLESADELTGTWTTVPGANPPSYTVAPTGSRKFFRVRVQ